MDDLLALFAEEFADSIDVMEQKLLTLDSSEDVVDDLNAIFRGAHSIKGSGGALGFMVLYDFTHIMETLLDEMREERIAPTEEIVDGLLTAVDILKSMQQCVVTGDEMDPDLGKDCLAVLKVFAEGNSGAPVADNSGDATGDEHNGFDIFFKPAPTLFDSGQEPAVIFMELEEYGEFSLTLNTDEIPASEEGFDPTRCYLTWQAQLETEMPAELVENAFEMVTLGEPEATVTITPTIVGDTAYAVKNNAEKDGIIEFSSTAAPEAIFEAEPTADIAAERPKKAAPKPTGKAPKYPAGRKAAAKPAATSIRVDVHKVDTMVNMIGELVITQSMLNSQLDTIPTDLYPGLTRGMQELARHTRELQESVMAMRMQPVRSIFSRIPRLVRDLAKELDKDIELVTTGEATEIDKTIIEQLSDPLTHMIRNSVDHGIETPEVRVANGKPAAGKVHLSADNSGGKIVITIEDDGAGINREKVLAKAIEKGIVEEDATLSPEDIDMLVFAPGFSTADQVSKVSGRGVGMDVVNRNIEDLGGSVSILNDPGKGLKFTLSLPLTLAILDGMIVQAGEEKYILPVNSIIETIKPTKDIISTVASSCQVIDIRNELLPLIQLSDLFDIPGARDDIEDSLVVIVETGRYRFGLIVDQLLGQQQIVIKSLEENADPVKGISGATILGDGEVSLIIDVLGIWQISDTSSATNLGSTPQLVAA